MVKSIGVDLALRAALLKVALCICNRDSGLQGRSQRLADQTIVSIVEMPTSKICFLVYDMVHRRVTPHAHENHKTQPFQIPHNSFISSESERTDVHEHAQKATCVANACSKPIPSNFHMFSHAEGPTVPGPESMIGTTRNVHKSHQIMQLLPEPVVQPRCPQSLYGQFDVLAAQYLSRISTNDRHPRAHSRQSKRHKPICDSNNFIGHKELAK
jgi:hypothetical protein